MARQRLDERDGWAILDRGENARYFTPAEVQGEARPPSSRPPEGAINQTIAGLARHERERRGERLKQ